MNLFDLLVTDNFIAEWGCLMGKIDIDTILHTSLSVLFFLC